MAGTMTHVHRLEVIRERVSMESGLDGRNNTASPNPLMSGSLSLNGVRPRWPEQ